MMKATTLIVIATSLILANSPVSAGHHSKPEQADKSYTSARPGFSYQKMLAGIELTPEQQQQLQQLIKVHRTDTPKRPRDNSQRDAMRQLIQADYFDEMAVTTLLQQHQQQRLVTRVAQLKLRHQIEQLLTPEQRQQLAGKLHQRKQHAQHNRNMPQGH
ncbi:Spy/CpxP family protein refolding chaperone [Arsukibacterium sp.]|uniref:Spy/CpxP family protein refolding chaperone n=1 Tax=Arsukibacterium sp. TaxID=1977258 RepID=UPI0035681173